MLKPYKEFIFSLNVTLILDLNLLLFDPSFRYSEDQSLPTVSAALSLCEVDDIILLALLLCWAEDGVGKCSHTN